jgi:hypothetical protein
VTDRQFEERRPGFRVEEKCVAYIETVPPEEATGLLRDLYDQDQKSLGYVANYTRAMSLHPEVIAAWRTLISAIRNSLDLRRFELVTLAAASKLNCSY